MTTQYRQDRFRQDLRTTRTGAGDALLCTGVVARPGIYLYLNADGTTRRELVPRETLAAIHKDGSAGALTLARAPVTLQHPPEMVTADNAAKYVIGDVDGEVAVDDTGLLRVKMAVRQRAAIDAIVNDGVFELSPGYWVEVDDTPGEDPEFGAYDSKQVSRKYNHLAIVDAARGGEVCRIQLDGADVTPLVSEAVTVTADGYETTSTYTSKSETDPSGTTTYTSTSETTEVYTPDPDTEESELPEGITPAMASWFKEMVREALRGDATPAADAPEPSPTAVTPAPEPEPTVVADGVADDFMARYEERKALESRADCSDPALSNAAIARKVLAIWSFNADGLSDADCIAKALSFPLTSAERADAKPTPGLYVETAAACYTKPTRPR